MLKFKTAYSNGNPFRDRFQSYRQTFRVEPDKKEAERIIKNIIKGREVVKNLIQLDVPDIAEDGNVVPVSFSINCSMTNEDYPKRVHVLGLENPFPEIAIYEFFPESGKAEVSFRCRLRASSHLMIIAEMNNGKIGIEKKYVDVMLGACS
ncbi:MAG: thiosulfate oxidation carrier protein SoxY [Pseudomonadota bacterium]|nr:thiosulfate oxidation carrier protein SoxY [Pseudomonadota bacterium]